MTVEESISCYYTVSRYGEYGARRKREVSQVHGAEVLTEARARGSRECYSSWLFLLRASFTNFFYETRRRGSMTKHRRREKKKKHSVEYFFLDGLWRNRHNPLAQTSAVALTSILSLVQLSPTCMTASWLITVLIKLVKNIIPYIVVVG